MLKNEYPAIYIAYCEKFDSSKRQKYIQECLALRDAGPNTYARYFHGGVQPTLKNMRECGNIK